MHGFLVHTTDQRLLVRNYEYIKHENPGWWQENLHWISSFWEFKTDDYEGMKSILHSLRRISMSGFLPALEVENFCISVGFDLEKFKKDNATAEAHFVKVKNQNWDNSEIRAAGGFTQAPGSDGFDKLKE